MIFNTVGPVILAMLYFREFNAQFFCELKIFEITKVLNSQMSPLAHYSENLHSPD